jgi:hypothetical protein
MRAYALKRVMNGEVIGLRLVTQFDRVLPASTKFANAVEATVAID